MADEDYAGDDDPSFFFDDDDYLYVEDDYAVAVSRKSDRTTPSFPLSLPPHRLAGTQISGACMHPPIHPQAASKKHSAVRRTRKANRAKKRTVPVFDNEIFADIPYLSF